MEITDIINDPKKLKPLRAIEQPANISSSLEISIETGLGIQEVEEGLRELENASFVRQEAGMYGITLEGIRTMKELRKSKLI